MSWATPTKTAIPATPVSANRGVTSLSPMARESGDKLRERVGPPPSGRVVLGALTVEIQGIQSLYLT